MNYGDLQSQVSGLLNRRDATTAQIQSWIQLALQRIQRELRIPAMEKTVTTTIVNDFDNLTIPADLLELIDIINKEQQRLTKEDVTRVLALGKTIGCSSYFYRMGGKWLLGHAPAAGDTFTIVYYSEIGQLAGPSDENIITDIAPDLITYAALGYAGDFFVDKRVGSWEDRFNQILTDIQTMADDDELTGGATVSPAYTWPDDSTAYGEAGPW